MDFVSGVVVFLMIWWTALFAVLPWGIKPTAEEDAVEGQVMSAPSVPNLKKKFLITTLITVILWLLIAYLIHIKVIDFHSLARTMHSEAMNTN